MHPLGLALALVLLSGAPTQRRLFDDETPTPPPLTIQFHEDAATKADVASLGAKIDRALAPVNTRLAAVEQKTDALARDVTALKLARQTTTTKAPAPPPLWELHDCTGVRCTGSDREELIDRVRRRNAWFDAQSLRNSSAISATPTYYAAPPLLDVGSHGGGFGTPMFGGVMMGGGGCAGGSCR